MSFVNFLNQKPAILILEDGRPFDGFSLGKEGETSGEVCFNTWMSGYKEIITDPSYSGQIVAMTYPHIGNYPVSKIKNIDVLKILKPIWSSKNETATRVRQRIEKILNWSSTLGYRDHPNPAALNGNLEYLLPKSSTIRSIQHHRSLAYENLPAFVSNLKKTNLYSAKALLFLILTASRTSEVIAAEWDEFNFKLKILKNQKKQKLNSKTKIKLVFDFIDVLNSFSKIKLVSQN